jgi:DNA-binding transcriptional MerR regulator
MESLMQRTDPWGEQTGGMTIRISIGDFSRMTYLSVKSLRRYHDTGLLEPANVDQGSGYRYYEAAQVPVGQVIRRFRDLGMPLEQVKEVLQAPGDGEGNLLATGPGSLRMVTTTYSIGRVAIPLGSRPASTQPMRVAATGMAITIRNRLLHGM